MKKTLIIFIFSFSLAQANAQSMSKRKQLAKEFLELITIEKYIDDQLVKVEDSLLKQTNYFFNQKKIDANIMEDVAYFKSNVHQQIDFINRSIKSRLLFIYKTYNYKKLKEIVKQIKKTSAPISEKKKAYKTVNRLISDEIKALIEVNIPGYLDFIYKKQTPVNLAITSKNQADKTQIDDILIIIDGYKPERISLFNKNNLTLSKPANYDDISGIVIIYKNHEFLFEPNPEIFRLPKKLSDMKNPVSKYCFEEVPEWKIQISEDDQKISITLISVEEFTTILNK